MTKAYVDQFRQENERSRRDLGIEFFMMNEMICWKNWDNDFNDNKLTNMDSITVNRNPGSNNEVPIKQIVDDSKGEGTVVRFNQTLEDYLKVSAGNDTYILTK